MSTTGLSRRNLLATGSAATLGLPSAGRAQTAAKYRRWEITDAAMPARVLDSYKKGIAAMLKLPPTDPRNWYRHAFIHVFDCPHGNWWFLPWHRGYLGWLEQTLRQLSGDPQFALPYWDWTKTPRIPAAMFDGVLDPNNAAYIAAFAAFRTHFAPAVQTLWGQFSPAQRAVLNARMIGSTNDLWQNFQSMFFARPNARGLTASNPALDPTTAAAVSIDTIRSALSDPLFAGNPDSADIGFASAKVADHNGGGDPSSKGILESQPHDNVHGAIGGPRGQAFMVSFLSPVDPIFFLHHGNLDRLWDVWTRRQLALHRPALPEGSDLATWQKEQFLFYRDAQGQPVSKTSAGDYASMTAFDYDYSPGSGEDQVPAAGAVVAAAQFRVFGAQITANAIGPRTPAAGTAQVPPEGLQALKVAQVTLDLQPGDQGRRFQVLIGAGDARPTLAGGITVFNHHVRGPTTFSVPLPPGLAPPAGQALNIQVLPLAPPSRAGLGLAPQAATRAVPLRGIRLVTG